MNLKRSILGVAILPALLAVVCLAQDDVVRVETNLVTLNVAVTARGGKYVHDLGKGNFTILDNGKKQEIDTFSSFRAPLSVGIVFDVHSSMDERTKSVLEALREFTQKLGPNDRFFVNAFAERGNLTTDFVPSEQQVRDWVDNGDRKGPTNLYDAIFAASNKVAAMPNPKKVLIVLTDGQDKSSAHSLKDLRLRLRGINLPVYSVTFSSENRRMFSYADINRNGPRQTFAVGEATDLDRSVLAELSKTSGGQSFEGTMRNRYYLTALCTKVLDEINNQYVIGFYPDTPDGKWHKLRVMVAGQPGTKNRISSRRGYQSRKR